MSMIEKMARAMVAQDSGPEGSALFAIHWKEFGDGYLASARAALTALLEPTEGMVEAGLASEWPATYREYLRHPASGPKAMAQTEQEITLETKRFRAAIQAALDGK